MVTPRIGEVAERNHIFDLLDLADLDSQPRTTEPQLPRCRLPRSGFSLPDYADGSAEELLNVGDDGVDVGVVEAGPDVPVEEEFNDDVGVQVG